MSYKKVLKTLKKSEKLEKALWDRKYPFGTKGTILKPDHQDVLDAAHWLADEHPDEVKHNRLAEDIQNKMLRHGELVNMPLEETKKFRAHSEDFSEPEYNKYQGPFKDDAERARRQAALKPIIVAHDGENYHVLDGQHRFNEAHKRGDSHIPVHLTHVDKIGEDAYGALKNIREQYSHQSKPRFEKSEKDLKTEKLEKGSFQRRHKFNPASVSDDEREKIEEWTSHVQNRDDIPEIDPNAKKRALNKLHSKTKVAKHPETGERMFLLHRGMGEDEYQGTQGKGENLHSTSKSSWTPHYNIAQGFGKDYTGDFEGYEPRMISAWVPESKIHHILPAVGEEGHGEGYEPKTIRHEHEIIVNPHNFKYTKHNPEEKPNLQSRINERKKISDRYGTERSLKFGTPEEQKNTRQRLNEARAKKLSEFNKQKLAASEKINNNLMKAPVELSIGASNQLGEDFKGVAPPEYVKGHAGSYETKDGMFHHVIDKKLGGVSHYLSTSKDPWDEKSQVAKIEGSPSSGSYTITHSSVRPEHKGKGYGKKLYMSVLAHHGDISSDNALTQRSHNAWKSLKDQTQGIADVNLAELGEKGTRHRAIGDKTKLQKLLHKRRIAPNKPGKLAASEQDVLFKNENLKTPSSQVKLNPEHGKTIASAYEQMKHDPSHPAVQKAYGALINETKKQFKDMMDSGLKVSRIQPGQENPYKNSKELHHDIKNNNHLHFFPTDQGFGSDESDKSDHPMMQGTGVMHDGKELLANDMFRIVHDYYGHHKGGESGFGPKGEHRAYLTHKKMFSPEAQKALTTETLMQNSWVNFSSKYGEHNRKNPHKTVYAEQKANIAPDWVVNGNWHSGDE